MVQIEDIIDILMILACIFVIVGAVIVALKYSLKEAVGILLMGGSMLLAIDAIVSNNKK